MVERFGVLILKQNMRRLLGIAHNSLIHTHFTRSILSKRGGLPDLAVPDPISGKYVLLWGYSWHLPQSGPVVGSFFRESERECVILYILTLMA